KQVHSLPSEEREIAYLARRLDYPDGRHFLAQYERTTHTVRAIYDKYVGEQADAESNVGSVDGPTVAGLPAHLARMEPSYQEVFSDEEIAAHAEMLSRLSEHNEVEVAAVPIRTPGKQVGHWRLTVAGRDHVGDLSMICGLLFVYGFDIVEGDVFTELPGGRRGTSGRGTEFINVFTVRPTRPISEDVWVTYEQELEELIRLVAEGKKREEHGRV